MGGSPWQSFSAVILSSDPLQKLEVPVLRYAGSICRSDLQVDLYELHLVFDLVFVFLGGSFSVHSPSQPFSKSQILVDRATGKAPKAAWGLPPWRPSCRREERRRASSMEDGLGKSPMED
jgi:hypothetical protein